VIRPRALRAPPKQARASDAELLAAIARGEIAPLGELYDRYAREVWRVVDRVTSGSPDAEDLVHATFLKVPELAASFDGRPSCRTWLCGVAVHLTLHHRRSGDRFRAMLAALGDTLRGVTSSSDPERAARHGQELAVFERALRRLSAPKRGVFVLIELEGLSHAETAAALGIPLVTVRTRLFHAKQALRHALERRRS